MQKKRYTKAELGRLTEEERIACAEYHYAMFMQASGISPDTPHTRGTPARVARLFQEFTIGSREPDFEFTAFPKKRGHTYDQLIVQKGIQFASMCAHHHLPFIGEAAVGYLPDSTIIGLSKLVRVVKWKAKKPSIQEDLTEEILNTLVSELKPKAAFVYLASEHHCITCRGVEEPGTQTITHAMSGEVAYLLKQEFLDIVRQ